MKKISIFLFGSLLCLTVPFITSCDEDYPGPDPVEVTANYSNKLTNPNPNLALTYSGEELIGKSVDFSTVKGEDANITLYNIIPREETLKLTNVPIIGDEEGYSFSGNLTTARNISFKYEGKVTKGKLTLNVSEVKLPGNMLSGNGGNGTWYLVHNAPTEDEENEDLVLLTTYSYSSYYQNDKTNTINWIFAFFAKPLLDNIFSIMLNDITFQSDGNITAHYAGFPEGVTFTDILPTSPTTTGGLYVNERPDSDYKLSGINLANYYMEDASTFYIIPNIDMILRQIQSDKTETRSISIDILIDLYSKLAQWTTTGIKFHIEENPMRDFVGDEFEQTKIKGDYIIYMDPSEIKVLIPILDILPDILKLVAPDMLDKTIGELAGDMLPPMLKPTLGNQKITDLLPTLRKDLNESNIKIGVYLYKSKQ